MFCVGLLIKVRIPRTTFLVHLEVHSTLWTPEDNTALLNGSSLVRITEFERAGRVLGARDNFKHVRVIIFTALSGTCSTLEKTKC